MIWRKKKQRSHDLATPEITKKNTQDARKVYEPCVHIFKTVSTRELTCEVSEAGNVK